MQGSNKFDQRCNEVNTLLKKVVVNGGHTFEGGSVITKGSDILVSSTEEEHVH